MTQPYFSVITPSYNHGRFIGTTIRSVLDQDYPSFEHLVMDGGSKDETLDVLRKYSHLRWISELDGGKTEALNKGFRLAKGQVIAWINADDYYTPGAFIAVQSFFKANRAHKVVVGRALVVDGQDRFLFEHQLPAETGLRHQGIVRFWRHGSLPQPSIFFHRSIFEKIGFLDEKILSYMDYDFFLRLSRIYEFGYFDRVLSCIRSHEGSETIRDIAAGQLDRRLFPISRRYWGSPASRAFWGHAFSFLLFWPRTAWRAHYQRFAFRARRELGALVDEPASLAQLWRSKHLFFLFPAAYLVAGLRRSLRRLGFLRR